MKISYSIFNCLMPALLFCLHSPLIAQQALFDLETGLKSRSISFENPTGETGEGEVKIYMDGDDEFPTICGTGSEDYVGLSYGIQPTTFQYLGANLVHTSDAVLPALDLRTNELTDMSREYISMYRWHLLDPIYWEQECRVTIQQIGFRPFFERSDDWSTATFWYESLPSKPLPKLVPVKERIADLDELFTEPVGQE